MTGTYVDATMTENEFDRCVAGFHAAAAGAMDWGQALRPLHDTFGLWVTQLFGMDIGAGSILFSFEVGDTQPEAFVDFARVWHRYDPRTLKSFGMGEGEWMNCREHFDDAFVERDPFYQQFLIPYGGRWASGTKLVHDGSFVAIVGLLRGVHSRPFSKEEDRLGQRLARHLAEAVRSYRSTLLLSSRAAGAAAVLERVSSPLLLVDEQRRIHYANPAVQRILADEGAVLIDRAGKLQAIDPDDDTRLLLALRQLRLSRDSYLGEGSEPQERTTLRLPLPASHLHLNLYLFALRPEASLGAFGPAPLAMALLRDPRQRLDLDPFMVAAAFDLTPAESQLAVGLARGSAIADIATSRGVSIETLRSQLKSVFQKTGTARQSELVSLLATLPE